MSDPFGRAVRDFARDAQDEPLYCVDDDQRLEHPIEAFYFTEPDLSSPAAEWSLSWLDGPLVDLGAGAGRHALAFQERFETVALEVSEHLVETMRERGVEDVVHGDMLSLRESFDRDRFRSAFAHGTQLAVAGSMDGLRRFLADLAYVTDSEGTAVFDCYDPASAETRELLGYRRDPTPGLGFRVMHFEYEGDVGETLLMRLFGPERVREAAASTPWSVADVRRGDSDTGHYRMALEKR